MVKWSKFRATGARRAPYEPNTIRRRFRQEGISQKRYRGKTERRRDCESTLSRAVKKSTYRRKNTRYALKLTDFSAYSVWTGSRRWRATSFSFVGNLFTPYANTAADSLYSAIALPVGISPKGATALKQPAESHRRHSGIVRYPISGCRASRLQREVIRAL